MAMTHDPIRESRAHCEHAFAFLVHDYGCRIRARYLDGSGYEVYYWNTTTGVRVVYQIQDPLYVYLCQLPAVPFPPGREEFGAYRRIEWFDLLDIIDLRTKQRPSFDLETTYGIPSIAVVEQYAEWVRLHCDSILRGDFSLFPELRRRVNSRIAQTNQFPYQPAGEVCPDSGEARPGGMEDHG